MTSAELVSELRAARPVASEELRERIRTIATAERAPQPRFTERLRLRRPLLVAIPVAAAMTLAVAGAIGFAQSDDVREVAPASTDSTSQEDLRSSEAAGQDAKAQAQAPVVGAGAAAPPPVTAVGPAPDRAQRFSASLTLEVEDIDALSDATQRALSLTRSLGGHVVTVSYASAESGTASMTLRIPSDRAQDAITRLSQLGTIRSQQVQIDDLQEGLDALDTEIVRLQGQIAALGSRLADPDLAETTRLVLRARLDAARADLAAARASRKATAAEAAFATIYVALQTPTDAAVASTPTRFDRALDEAAGVLAWEGIVLLYAAIVAAPLVLAGLAAWLVRRGLRRREEERLLTSSAP
jgi:hypothetical protein